MNTHHARNLGLDLVRATEASALAAGRYMGLGQPDKANLIATDSMHSELDTLQMRGHIVVGEESHHHYQSSLDTGQVVGSGNGPEMDVMVDPVDGRRLLSEGQAGAIAVAAVAPSGSMWSPTPGVYMEKIVTDREVGVALVEECLDAPAAWTLSLIARVKHKEVRDLIVFVLERPRHADLINEIRASGARVMLRTVGDISGALLAASGLGKVDVMMGIGGVPEGVISACAVKSMGGAMLGRLAPQSDQERSQCEQAGLDLKRILRLDDIITSDEIYFAVTGITDGPLLDGVRYRGDSAETHSLILRCETMTRRFIRADHLLEEI
jgi:fructose-1,6-bisphosphatase II